MCGILYHYSIVDDFSEKAYEITNIDEVIAKDLNAETSGSADSVESLTIKETEHSTFNALIPRILARGSDYCGYMTRTLGNGQFEAFSSVLSLRPPLTEQPFVKDSRFIIQFNGELYNKEIDSDDRHINDIVFTYNKLVEYEYDVVRTIGVLEGEFAYCITDMEKELIYFGKDVVGKKSLGYYLKDGELIVSSCLPIAENKTNFRECRNAIVYSYDPKASQIEQLSFNDDIKLPNTYYVNNNNSNETENLDMIIETLRQKLTSCVRSRIETIFPVHKSVSKFGLLFSGGIDCTLLAALAAAISPDGITIDLLNVSFNNPRAKLDPASTPDRKLALKSWLFLQSKYPHVTFNLVEADVSYDEYYMHRKRVIGLIYPNDTEMDLSIAIAFYFAARGWGKRVIYDAKCTEEGLANLSRVEYKSECKVLLSGLGADELFGGYTRHERIFTGISNQVKRKLKGKHQTDFRDYDLVSLVGDLRNELQGDLSNLYTRNLSRDDKVISCWSKELRYPFLDHHFIQYVSSTIPIDYKLRYISETGEIIRKHALRLLAREMGLDWIVNEPKRAIQFGAKSAKLEEGTGKMKGTDKLS